MDPPASLLDFSLVQGGPLFRLERRLHLVPTWPPSQSRRLLAFMVPGWVPLLVLTAAQGEPAALRAFLLDLEIHTRMLVSLPLLLAAEPYIDGRLAMAARQFVYSKLVDPRHLGMLDDAARGVMRLRDSVAAEVGLLLASFLPLVQGVVSQVHQAWSTSGGGGQLTLAGWWFVAVSRPLLLFLMLRWLWRGVLWAIFLFRVSRVPLALVPTHPDVTGGLRFLSTAQSTFAPIVFALGAVLAVHQRQVSPTGDLTGSALQLLILGGTSLIILFVPLLPFCRQLLAAKRRGDHHFTAVAAHHSRNFERRWFSPDTAQELEPLGAPEFSSLADLGTAFNVEQGMRWFPVSRRAVVAIIGAALAPLVPVLVIDRQFLAVLLAIAQKLLF